MSTSEKNGSSFPRDEEEWLDLSTRPENSETTKKAMEFPLIVFRQYLKEKELDEDRLVDYRSYAFVCINSARNSAISTQFPKRYFVRNKFSDQMIKQLLNSVLAKYRDLSVSRRSIICLSLRLRQIIDLLATNKSRYFAQPRPITVKYFQFRKLFWRVNNT